MRERSRGHAATCVPVCKVTKRNAIARRLSGERRQVTPDELAWTQAAAAARSGGGGGGASSQDRHDNDGSSDEANVGRLAGGRAGDAVAAAPVWERAAQRKAEMQRRVAVSKVAVLAAEEAESQVRPKLTAAAAHKIRTTQDLTKWAQQRKPPSLSPPFSLVDAGRAPPQEPREASLAVRVLPS
jgi:hypothetical protein